MKKVIAFVLSLVGAYLVATPVGKWFASNYAVGGSFVTTGPFPGFIDGLLFGYIFFASIIFPVATGKLVTGFYAVLPVLLFDILLAAWNPQLWMDIILIAIGLGLAWLILRIKNHTKLT